MPTRRQIASDALNDGLCVRCGDQVHQVDCHSKGRRSDLPIWLRRIKRLGHPHVQHTLFGPPSVDADQPVRVDIGWLPDRIRKGLGKRDGVFTRARGDFERDVTGRNKTRKLFQDRGQVAGG